MGIKKAPLRMDRNGEERRNGSCGSIVRFEFFDVAKPGRFICPVIEWTETVSIPIRKHPNTGNASPNKTIDIVAVLIVLPSMPMAVSAHAIFPDISDSLTIVVNSADLLAIL